MDSFFGRIERGEFSTGRRGETIRIWAFPLVFRANSHYYE